ncbi:hypothetical protein BCR34DRAFT_229324 [Clohesyomyces aquaticus]|uniref:Uncharacterized protein n=1 Tax=Clohesyomyces aquaticus TaxID=1231657 RepID=A0A1Y1ZWK3_9PLEO|nr:hypothetical protein BCR34DRAFT_229324 [Clohesyomyces aquaticus]
MITNLSYKVAILAFFSSIPYTLGETVVLANCQGNSGKWSEIAYYSGGPTGNPNAIVVVPGTSGGTVWWEGRSVSATFTDGNVFTSHIRGDSSIPEGGYAGPGENLYQGFNCFHHWVPNLYQSPQGGSCGQIYYCNHDAPHDGLRIDFDVWKETVDLVGDFNPYDVYGKVWDRYRTPFFDNSAVQLTDLCSISFEGHGAADNVNGNMAKTLQEIVGKRDEAAKKATSSICTKYRPIEHGQKECIEWGTRTVTTMPKTIKIDAVNIPNNGGAPGEAGYLTTTITCIDPNGVDCNLCKGLSGALGLFGLVGEAAAIWGFAGIVTSAVCASQGC